MNKKLLSIFLILPILCFCEVLRIKKQGMFSAGGTVHTSDGVFDVSNYYTSRAGSTLLIMQMYFIKFPNKKQDFQWSSFMDMVNRGWVG